MAVVVQINGSTVGGVLLRTLSVDMALNERSTARMTTNSRLTVGHSVAVFDNSGVRIFGGSVDECKEVFRGGTLVHFESLCVSFEARADRRNFGPRVFGQRFTVDAATDVLTSYGHGLAADQPVRVRTTNTLPGGLAAATTYYARDITTNTFKLAASSGGAAIDITSAGTGAHTFLVRAKEIVTEVIAAMGGDAIGTGTIGDGEFGRYAFNYGPCSAALEQLAIASNYVWRIEPDGDLTFHARTANAAPFNITNTSGNVLVEALNYRQTRQDLTNTQYRRIAFEAQDPEVETFDGDASTTQFWLAKRATRIDSITVDGEVVSLGIDGVDTGQDVYWIPEERTIRFEVAPAVGTGNIAIRYREFGADFIFRDDATKVSARATVEGNSGIYASFIDDGSNTDAVGAVALADKDIAIFGDLTGEISYNTRVDGLQPGQLQTVTQTKFNLSSVSFLINRVTAQLESSKTSLLYSVSAISGTRLNSIVDLFKALASSGGGGSSASTAGGSAAGGSTALVVEVTLTTASTTINAPTASAGAALYVVVTTDATNGRQITWGAAFHSSTPVEFANAASTTTIFHFLGRSDNLWHLVSQRS